MLLLVVLSACSSAPPLALPAKQVTLIVDGDEQAVETEADTVGQLLKEEQVTLGTLDRVTPAEVSALQTSMIVTVVRVTQTTDIITQTTPFNRQVVRDANIPEGETQLLQTGQAGTVERHYRITFEDGEEVERALVKEVSVTEPRDEVRLIGTKGQLQNIPITGTLAYLSHQDAWVVRHSTFQSRPLTSLGDLDGRVFELSPDGSQLLFTRAATETDSLNELWLVRTTEASPKPIPLNSKSILWADWAPDGETIAWTTAETQAQAPGWRGQNDLWQATLTQRSTLISRKQILKPAAGGGYGWWGTRYAWAPDGTSWAYSRPESVGIVNRADGEVTELIEFPVFRTFSSWSWNPTVAWSPDGHFLTTGVHVTDGSDEPEESPIFNLLQIATPEAYSATIAIEVGMWTAPHYSPNGDTLLFGRAVIPYTSATSRYTLYLADRDGSDQQLLYAPEDGGLELPEWTWSPDGQGIAFIAYGDVQRITPDSTVVETLTEDGSVTRIEWR